MRLSKKIIDTITLTFFTAVVVCVFSACTPAIGTPWYPRSASSSSGSFVITGIQVKGLDVVPVLAETPSDDADKIKKFSETKTYTVNVPSEMAEVTAEDVAITAISSLSHKEALPVEVTVNGGSVPLSAGKVVPVTIKIADLDGKYAVQEKVLSITQSEPYDLNLTSLKVFDRELVVDGSLQRNITIPYTVSAITAKDITATFTYGPHTTVIPVELGKPSIKLYENEEKEITISVKEKKGQYYAFSQTITVTRERKPDDADPVLEPESIFILGIRYEVGKPLGVPMDTQRLTEADVVTVFKDFGELPVTLNPNPAEFGDADSIELKLSIPSQMGKYVGWETSITVKKDPTALNNPKDKNGNKKYIVKVKTITETVSPFDFYKQDYEFPASKFDEWVLVMPSMSGIIASYKFQPGSWSGSPEMIDNIPSGIGSGLKAISNVKIYRYKTRVDRWSASNGYVPAGDPNDSRFYFYRFTADASMGIKADNSMFCVDKYSKFLFYYSEPAKIKWIAGSALPTEWTDYAAASIGDHIQFTEPFYMSDPVGYVKADGSVVIYSWLKDNINNAKYHAQKNSAYTKPAGRSPGQAGYSPYRDNIINKHSEVETTVNSAYTVAVPVILGQPRAVRVPRNTAADKAFFMVKTAPAPEGEQLSYQWYTNTTQSNEGGMPISSATNAVYAPDTSAETDCFVYCEVTNTNGSNNQTETVKSDAVKLLISDGSLAVDAEQPRIVRQPVGKVIPINTSGDTAKVTLTVEAVSLDKGVISYQWYRNTADTLDISDAYAISGATEASYSFTADTSSVKTEYYYCKVTNTNKKAEGKKTAFRVTDTAEVKVEESYKVTFSKDEDGGYLTALHNGNSIESGTYVKKGEEVKFVVTLKPRHKVKDWVGATALGTDKVLAVLKVQDTDAAVSVSIEPKMTLTVTPKIENESLKSWSTADGDHFSHKYIDGAHFAHDLAVTVNANGNTNNVQWKYDFPIKGNGAGNWFNGGHGEYVENADFIEEGKYKEGTMPAKNFSNFSEMNLVFKTYLIKSNRLDYWRSEWTTSGGGPVYPKQPLDNNSIIKLVYNETTGKWSVDTGATNIQRPERVTISYPTDFTLVDGEEKDFVITYTVNNNGYKAGDSYKDSDDGGENEASTRSKGTVKVIYTIGWK